MLNFYPTLIATQPPRGEGEGGGVLKILLFSIIKYGWLACRG
jgi:hypothetical protein